MTFWNEMTEGRILYMRYESVSKINLPANVTIKKARAIGLRQQRKRKQQDQGCSVLH